MGQKEMVELMKNQIGAVAEMALIFFPGNHSGRRDDGRSLEADASLPCRDDSRQ